MSFADLSPEFVRYAVVRDSESGNLDVRTVQVMGTHYHTDNTVTHHVVDSTNDSFFVSNGQVFFEEATAREAALTFQVLTQAFATSDKQWGDLAS